MGKSGHYQNYWDVCPFFAIKSSVKTTFGIKQPKFKQVKEITVHQDQLILWLNIPSEIHLVESDIGIYHLIKP